MGEMEHSRNHNLPNTQFLRSSLVNCLKLMAGLLRTLDCVSSERALSPKKGAWNFSHWSWADYLLNEVQQSTNYTGIRDSTQLP